MGISPSSSTLLPLPSSSSTSSLEYPEGYVPLKESGKAWTTGQDQTVPPSLLSPASDEDSQQPPPAARKASPTVSSSDSYSSGGDVDSGKSTPTNPLPAKREVPPPPKRTAPPPVPGRPPPGAPPPGAPPPGPPPPLPGRPPAGPPPPLPRSIQPAQYKSCAC